GGPRQVQCQSSLVADAMDCNRNLKRDDVRSGIASLEPADIATTSRVVADQMFARPLIFGRLAHDSGGHEQWHANPAIIADANRRRYLKISDAGVGRAA